MTLNTYLEQGESKFDLYYNESLLLMSHIGTITVELPDFAGWKVKFIFEDVGDKDLQDSFVEYDNGNKIAKLFYRRWYSDAGIENSKPQVLSTKNGKKFLHIKVRTNANKQFNQRRVSITIWLETKN
jgi:hypothetical protein